MNYFLLHSNTSSEVDQTISDNLGTVKTTPSAKIPAYLEAHFSTPPASFTIQDPVSGEAIVTSALLTDNEWSGEIHIPTSSDVELNVKAIWQKNSKTTAEQQHFIQLIVSPDGKDDASATLRSADDIDTTATFHWHK